MSLLILVLSLLLIIEILEIKTVQNRKYVALKVSDNDFVTLVNDKKVMTNFTEKWLYRIIIILKNYFCFYNFEAIYI